MSKLSQNILEQIKDQGLKPKPRWVFTGWNVLLIFSVLLTSIVGGLMMGIVIMKFAQVEWKFVPELQDGSLPGFWEVMPLMWLFLLLFILGIGGKVFERIEGAYKYSHWLVVGGASLLSLLLGGVAYASGIADTVENSLRGSVPAYEQMEQQKEQKWNMPEKGLLPGRVVEIDDEGFELEDLKDEHWQVNADSVVMKKAKLKQGEMVMAVGSKEGDFVYKADEIKKKPAFGGVRMKQKLIKKLPLIRPLRLEKRLEKNIEGVKPRPLELRNEQIQNEKFGRVPLPEEELR